jgi:hypothetical protein
MGSLEHNKRRGRGCNFMLSSGSNGWAGWELLFVWDCIASWGIKSSFGLSAVCAFLKKKNRDSITDVSANTGFSERKHSNLYLGNNSSSFDHFACFYHTRFKCNYDAERNDPSERNHNIDCGHKLEDVGWKCELWNSCCRVWHRWPFGRCNSLIIIRHQWQG